jgi:hypothetical protein
LDWLKSDPTGFEIKSALHRESAGDSFVLNTNNLRGSLNTSGSFVNNGGSFLMSDVGSASGSYVNSNAANSSGNNPAAFGSGSFLNLHNLNNSGSFVNNNPTPAAHMPPPRPVKRTPVNSNTNHTNIPHSAGVNGYASGISAKPGGFAPLLRRRRYAKN